MGLISPVGVFFRDQRYKTFPVLVNKTLDTLDVELAAGDSLPVTRTDTTFNGVHSFTEIVSGKIQQEQYYGWADTASFADTTTVDDATAYDDTLGGQLVFNAIFGSASSLLYYEGESVFQSESYSLDKAGRINSDLINLTKTNPTNTTIIVEMSVSKDSGVTWGEWAVVTDGAGTSFFDPSTYVRGWMARYRVRLSNTVSATATLSQFKHTIKTPVIYRMDGDGVMRNYNGSTGALSPVTI